MSPDLDAYRLCYRLLETDDEYFNYNTSEVPGQGRWYAYGLYLPDDVLKKVYRENAMKVLKIPDELHGNLSHVQRNQITD